MNKGTLQLIKTILSGIKIGKRLSDKIAIFKLLTKHVLVNRGLAKFSGNLHKPINCIFKNFPFTIYLRDNGTDANIFYDVFINECYKTSSYAPAVIYDLGTNIGIASLYFASVFPKAKIYGFEPMPGNYEVAKLNYSSIKNESQVYELAVGNENKDIFLNIDEYNSGAHRVCDESSSERKYKIPIKMLRLDTLINQYKIPPPDFLKIDTEGSESIILEGLGEFRKQVQYICLETHSLDLHNNCKEWIKESNLEILFEKPFTNLHMVGYLCALKK